MRGRAADCGVYCCSWVINKDSRSGPWNRKSNISRMAAHGDDICCETLA